MAIVTNRTLAVDGDFGFKTAQAFQIYLKNYGYWKTGSYDRFYYGVIDGNFGPMSKAGLQRYLAWHGDYSGAIDGWIGPMCRAAFLNHGMWMPGALEGARLPNTGFEQTEDAIRNDGWPKADPTWNSYIGTRFIQTAINSYHNKLVYVYPMHERYRY